MFIIPSPKSIEQSGKNLACNNPDMPISIASNQHTAEIDNVLDIIKNELGKVARRKIVSEPGQNNLSLEIVIGDKGFEFLSNTRNKEAYILKSCSDTNRIILAAKNSLGILHAAMTLRQLIKNDNGNVSIPGVCICDYPDVEYRVGARWLLCAEACRWAYDWGDGREKLLERIKGKIDFCMQNKINAVFFDGFSWNTDKYPKYSADMRMLNHYSRLRGVKLVFGGHGIGVGGCGKDAMLAEAHDSPHGLGGDYNRKNYPDGETYPCSGNNPKVLESRFNGTCRSNEALNQLKKQDLIEYVRKIEPSALYIHHEDQNLFYEEGQKVFWDLRCPDCRGKWPDDRLEKIGGGASAIAHGYNVLCEALTSVKNPKTNYDAAKDCTIFLVSPGYGSVDESDAIWDKTVELWTNISKEMKYKENVLFGFREQFRREDNGKMRIKEMADSLNKSGQGHGMFLFAVGGADLYLNDALYSATPVLNNAFEGATSIFNFSGVVFQEPQELLNSEYTWNINSNVYSESIPSRDEAIKLYEKYAYKRYIPAPIKVFLEKSCRYLYGNDAADYIRQFYLLGSETQEYPLCIMYYRFSLKKFFQCYHGEIAGREKENTPEKWKEILEQTRQGVKLIEKALACKSIPTIIRPDVDMLFKCLTVGEKFADAVCWILVKTNAKKVNLILCELEEYIADNFQFNFTSPGNSDIELWPIYIKKLKEIVNNDNKHV